MLSFCCLFHTNTHTLDMILNIIRAVFALVRGEEAARAGGPDISTAPARPLLHSCPHEHVERHQHQCWDYLVEWLCQWDAGQGRGVTCAGGSRKRHRGSLPPYRSHHFWTAGTLEEAHHSHQFQVECVHTIIDLLLADVVGWLFVFLLVLFVNRSWCWYSECRLLILTSLRRNWELLKKSWTSITKTGSQCHTSELASLGSKSVLFILSWPFNLLMSVKCLFWIHCPPCFVASF